MLEDVEITFDKVKEALSKLSSKAAPGPDGVVADCLKLGGSEMTNFLVLLFRSSMDSSDVPQLVWTALITPAFKAGERSQAKNYRPIALTSHLSKVFERVIRPQIVFFLESLGLMDGTQHGC